MSFLSSLSGNQKLLLGATLASAAGLFLYKKHSCCSSSSTKSIATSGPKVDYSKKSKQQIETEFKQVFQELKKFILDDIKNNYEVPKENIEYVERILDYNVPHGKLNRGLAVVDTLLILNSYQVSEKQFHSACVLGWCIEFLQAFFLVADDIMDASITRRGQDCWYRLEDVKMTACNDYLIVESHIYKILKHYFNEPSLYVPLVDLFHEVTYMTELGQLHDLRSLPPNVDKNESSTIPFHTFNIQTYSLIVKYKTAFYSFYLPLYCGLILSNKLDENIRKQTLDISIAMGEYFQIQDDYLDCYGDPSHIGKVGRDIEDCKCSWLVVKALELANEEQVQVLKANYGKEAPEKVKLVKDLYKQLNLEELYKSYEQTAIQAMNQMIDRVPDFINKDIYRTLLNKIANRTK
ncbi:hypothetical protein C9374_011875 [Naegleria lovaniensis]|uniref:Farnesyl diphosphate synthase n=1 Tax=Naegleria lovaniensis TaxID=51637 RepID=A0AA88GGR0_NAELO|nr:uncharacterized protein C9374_011875 [Naegleria lovaniensis]KAG2373786.1 hypothetical protein C9374_011875 [Naegleria lovaniensis]